MIYFDNAATSGVKPQTVVNAVKYALENYCANPGRSGHTLSTMVAEKVYETREKLSRFFNSDGAETVIFTQNCTHSINCVLKGILKKGDHCVISSLEHNAVVRPLVKTGITYSVATVSLIDDKETVENFKAKIKPNTRLVLCTGASNVLGKILPIEEIGKMCKSKGIMFCVDAAQTAGVLPIDMQKMNIDFLCIAPHKGLYAPMGVGVFIARKNLPNTIIEGGTGTNSLELYQPDTLPERLESGTVNVPAIVGISAGVDYVEKIGINKIYKGELGLIQSLYSSISNLDGITVYTPFPKEGMYAPLISFNVKGMESSKASAILSQNGIAVRGGLHCAPFAHGQIGTLENGTVRVSVSSFNNHREIEVFSKILKLKLLKNS